MKLIRFADLTPKPWKNGGGTTTEIAVSPEGAGFDDFDWRVSVADVASDGPFSLFRDIDRTLTLIEGNGLTLAIQRREPVTLTTASDPLSFPGDVPVTASLVDGAIRDFNVMTRRGRCGHAVMKFDLDRGPALLTDTRHGRIIALAAGTLEINEEHAEVDCGDLIELGENGSVRVSGSGQILFFRIW